jgi:beta-galactosidase
MGDCWFSYDHSYTCGQFYWGGTDYIGESFAWPSKGWVNGLLDLCDEFKPIAYYVQSFYSDKPMVRIAIFDEDEDTKKLWNDVDLRFQPMHSHWNWKEGQMLNLIAFTNCRQVELFINNKSLGVKNLADAEKQKIQWQIPYEPGVIKAVGRIGKKVVSEHTLKTAGKPVRILLNADKNIIAADGLDLAYITARVVDENEVIVPSAENMIKFTVTGAAVNAGICSSNLLSDELWQSDQRKAYEGRCLLVVRAKRQSGTVAIKASAEGLESAHILLKSK